MGIVTFGMQRFSDPFPRRSERIDFEAQAEAVEEVQETEKRRAAQVSKKGHKKKVFHKSDKPDVKTSSLLTRMMEPVVDPHKKERDAEFRKNPFRGLDRGRW
jgi:hypothetical protein